MFFNYFLLGHAENWFKAIFIGLGILYGTGLCLMCLKIKEGEYPPPEQPTDESRGVVGGIFATHIKSFSIIFVCEGVSIMALNTLIASYGQRLYPKALFAQFNSATLMMQGLGCVLLAPLVGKYLDLTGNHYNHVFFIGSAIALAGLISLFVVYRYFLQLGGDENYQAPAPRDTNP